MSYVSKKKKKLRINSVRVEDIEPKKVFIGNLDYSVTATQLQKRLKKHVVVTDMKIIADKCNGSKTYAFATLQSEEDAKLLIDLRNKPAFCGRKITIKPAKKKVIWPYMDQYEKLSLFDVEFDLTPLDPSKISGHVLDNDVLLKIFEYLPLTSVIRAEIVCRRWQSLVYKVVSMRFKRRKYYLLNGLSFEAFQIKPSLPVLCKLFIIFGEEITRLSIFSSSVFLKEKPMDVRVISLIGNMCPNLEEITLYDECKTTWLTSILAKCEKLKNIAFIIVTKAFSIDKHLNLIFKKLSDNLLELRIESWFPSKISYNINFENIPKCLRKLIVTTSIFISSVAFVGDGFTNVYARCPNLTTLITNFQISRYLKEIGRSCKYIKELGIPVSDHNDLTVEVKELFSNLRTLHLFGDCPSLALQQCLNVFSEIKELELKGMLWNRSEAALDFSILSKLKYLSLPRFAMQYYGYELAKRHFLTVKSLESLKGCKRLEMFSYMGTKLTDCKLFFKLLEGCLSPKEINLPRMFSISMSEETDFIVPNKGSQANRRVMLLEINFSRV